MLQQFIILFLLFVLLDGYICRTITSATNDTLAAFETASGSSSGPDEWVMEGYSPQRDRATSAYLLPPLRLGQELVIGGEIPVSSPVAVAGDLLLVEGNRALYALTPEGEEL